MWQDGSRKVFIPVTGDPEFYGLITAAAGFIGGWEIFPTYLQSNNIRLDSAGIIQTLDFLSGIKGWKVNETGDAEFNNIRARGAVKTVVFEKDEISVVGGRTLIRPAGLITSNYTDWLNKSTEAYFEDCWTLLNSILGESNPYIPEVFANYQEYYDAELLYFNNLNEVLAPDPSPEFEPFIGNVGAVITTENADQFNVGDFIRIKDGLSNDFWGEVTDKSGDDLTVEVKYGDLFNITAGQIIVNYGIAGSGGILLDGQTPLIDVYTHNGMPWLETDIKVRIGNLNGWGDIVSDVYGIAIGNASGEYLIYDSTSSRLRIKGAIVLGADSSVDGTYIDDDSIETRHLQAGSVTADIVDATVVKTTELQVYGKNRCIDPAFDGVPYSATFTNPGFSSVGSRLGKWEIVVQTGSINSYGYHKLSTSIGSVASDNGANAMGWAIGLTDKTATIACKSDAFAVNPSTPYHLSICTHNGTGRVPTGTLKAEWYTSSGSLISTSTIATFNPTATPTRRGGSATSPATAAICRVRIELAADATNGGGALIFSAAQVEEGATATAWVNREQGTVTADRIVTGQVKSLNYSTTTGSLLDIDNGNFTVGGSTAPVFALNAIAKTGQLSGFSFNVTDMTAGSTTNAIGISTDTDKKAFWAGSETPADGKFFVGHDGFLHAEYGAISGFTITATDLTAGSGSSAIGISTDAAKKAFWAGDETPADAPFFVNNDGSGLIAGFEFNGTDLTSGTGSTAIGISTDPAKKAFWAGNETPADAPFFVNSDGTGKIGLLTFTSSLIAHYSLDKNYHPLDPAHLVRTFAIAPNLDGWKGAAMQFVDDYNDSGVYLDTTLLSFGAFAGEALALEPYSTKTKSTAMLRLAATSSQYAIVTGGIIEGYISNLSDKNIKKDFTKTNTLHKLMQLDVSEWSYDDEAIARKEYEKQVEQAIRRNKPMPIKKQGGFVLERGHRHIGPTAKEFNELFGVSGGNPESIGVGDQIGVTMRAIQELAAIVFEQANEIAELRKALKLPEKQQKTGDADEYFLLTDEEQD
ncbi:hypothetical protein EOM57_05005 [Candidatus Saccharibacteria bacterium]|nr:hypothetical protein [Candidatus Saccharibacteria bacterium]